MVPDASTEISRLAAATANRLRLVQVDFAEANAKTRDEYMSETVERALAQIVPEKRQEFLAKLLERFPSWDSRVEVSLRKRESTDRPITDGREVQDPNFLVARLISLAPLLADEEKRVLAERLREAGLVEVAGAAWSAGDEQALRKQLKIRGEKALNASKALDLVSMLVNFAASLDQLIWSAWRHMAPRSEVRRAVPLRTAMAQLITDDKDVSRSQVMQELEKLRQLIASVVSASGQAGRQFAGRFLARLLPAEIESVVNMEGGGFLVGREVKCWRKYVELADTLSEDAVESEMTEMIASYAESLMKGLGR